MEQNLLGERFQSLRKNSGLTQAQVAGYLDLDQSYISKYEKGERHLSIDVLERAAQLFGCALEYFFDESSEYCAKPLAFRAEDIKSEDLSTIAAINKIALNLSYMEELLDRNKA